MSPVSLPAWGLAKYTGLAILFVVGAAALAACSGSSDPEIPDAGAIYAEAGDRMATISGYQVSARDIEGGRVRHFQIDYNSPDRFRLVDENQFTFLGIGDQFFVQPRGSGSYFSVADDTGFPLAADFLNSLTTEITNISYLKRDTFASVPVHHLSGTLPHEIYAMVEPDETDDVRIEIWIAANEPLILGYLLSELGETTQLNLFNFDQAPWVADPEEPRPAAELEIEQFKIGLQNLPERNRQCLREALGERALAELMDGARLPTDDEALAGQPCFE